MRLSSASFLEKLRLKDLYQYKVLDSGKEEEFEKLVELAREILKCPIAAITFIDRDRQYLKAARGLTISETHRDISFCHHTIKHDKVLVIEDALRDRRFVNNPLVQDGPGIRFYAGAPVISRAGFKIGSVCLIDTQPRQLNPECRKALEQVAQQVSRLLELRLESQLLGTEAGNAFHQRISFFHRGVQGQEEQTSLKSKEFQEETAQDLAAARLYLRTARRHQDASLLAESQENLTRLLERTKGFSTRIFPPMFPDLDLAEMVEDFSIGFKQDTGIEVKVYQSKMQPIGRQQRSILFRIIQEQLNNIRQQRSVRHVIVRVQVEDRIEITIVDDGDRFRDLDTGQGNAFNKMLSLAQYYGGCLDFFEPAQQGSGLRISMPVAV